MSLRVRERLGVADLVTLLGVVIGVIALAAAVEGRPQLTAQLLLLAAVVDGLDGIVARRFGGTAVGPHLDSIADVVSFGAAPALLVYVVARQQLSLAEDPELVAVAAAVASLFVVLSVVRTGLYTVYVGEGENRPGIQNTLAASVLAAAYLAGLSVVPALLAVSVVLSVLMVAPVTYPKLLARDALALGVVQAGAILQPTALDRLFPRLLLIGAMCYLIFGPWLYWGE